MSSLVLAASFGCSSGAPAFHPTVAGGTPLSQVSPGELDIICIEQLEYNAMLEQSPAAHETLCRQAGRNAAFTTLTPSSTDADVRQACQTAHDACALKPPVVPAAQADAVACASTITLQSDCTATVDQYAACVTALSASWTTPGATCDMLTVGALVTPTDAGAAGLPPVCVTLGADCPELTRIFLGTGGGVM